MAALNKLSAQAVESAHAEDRSCKLFDGGGLFLLVTPKGRYWRLKYRWGGKEKLLALGTFPDVTLKKVRKKRQNARDLLDDGIDPMARRKAEKAARAQSETFEDVAREWLPKQTTLAKGTRDVTLARWKRWVFPHIGCTRIDQLEPPDVLKALRRIEAAGKHETAHRMRQRIGQVCRYAIATGRATRDPTAALKDALSPVPTKHRAAITDPEGVAGLLRAIDGYDGQPATRAALQLLPLVFVRPGELRHAKWSELDLDVATWRIPAGRMKMKREHVVPLSTQAVEILRAWSRSPATGPTHSRATAQGGPRPTTRSTWPCERSATATIRSRPTGSGRRPRRCCTSSAGHQK